jgi:hypothetical protein
LLWHLADHRGTVHLRASDPTAGLLNRGTKSSLDWEGGGDVHLGPCPAHRGRRVACFCSRARESVFAKVELTAALDDVRALRECGTGVV